VLAPVVPEIDTRIAAQRKHLEELLQRFTDAHPDVINARRQLAASEEEKRHAAASAKSGAGAREPGAPGTAATSPVYQKLRFALAESEAQVASLRSQLAVQTGRLAQVRALASRVPEVEAELAQLTRDYDVVRKNYDLLVARRESASLGVKLDESSQLADFRIVEPPHISPKPVFPSRVQLACIALLLSVAAGIATALVMGRLRPTVASAAELQALVSRPVIGTVTWSMTPAVQRALRLDSLKFAGAATLLFVVQVGLVLWVATHNPIV
jgi:polysaccharide chain length determinant protein (PEP-CTERM system associated)